MTIKEDYAVYGKKINEYLQQRKSGNPTADVQTAILAVLLSIDKHLEAIQNK